MAQRTCTGTPSWSYFVTDHLGSIATITNAAGTVTQNLSYDAWGRRRNSNGTDDSHVAPLVAIDRVYVANTWSPTGIYYWEITLGERRDPMSDNTQPFFFEVDIAKK